MLGWLEDLTHSDRDAMYFLALVLVAGAATLVAVPAELVELTVFPSSALAI